MSFGNSAMSDAVDDQVRHGYGLPRRRDPRERHVERFGGTGNKRGVMGREEWSFMLRGSTSLKSFVDDQLV